MHVKEFKDERPRKGAPTANLAEYEAALSVPAVLIHWLNDRKARTPRARLWTDGRILVYRREVLGITKTAGRSSVKYVARPKASGSVVDYIRFLADELSALEFERIRIDTAGELPDLELFQAEELVRCRYADAELEIASKGVKA